MQSRLACFYFVSTQMRVIMSGDVYVFVNEDIVVHSKDETNKDDRQEKTAQAEGGGQETERQQMDPEYPS